MNPKITPCLWFDNNAEEAVNFYMSVFDHSRITNITRYGKNAPLPEGTALLIEFQLHDQYYKALNGGPAFPFTEAISLVIDCETQKEIDYYWEKLLADGGKEQQCGWLKDKYGLSWQIVPNGLGNLMNSGDAKKTENVTKALLKMVKIDIATLESAFNQ